MLHHLADVVRHVAIGYDLITQLSLAQLDAHEGEAVEVRLKYAGYIARQQKMVERLRSLDGALVPGSLWDSSLHGLSHEAREKLRAIRPATIGQASRIAGVSPADVSVLLVLLKRHRGSDDGVATLTPIGADR
jgi:tRNA uridine 5-carboxymethylaminomethyl modification enzyme